MLSLSYNHIFTALRHTHQKVYNKVLINLLLGFPYLLPQLIIQGLINIPIAILNIVLHLAPDYLNGIKVKAKG